MLVIREEAGKLVAVGKSPQGERPYDSVAVEGSKITLVITISYNGSPMVITYNGKVDKDKMGGEADYGGLATGTWSATARSSRRSCKLRRQSDRYRMHDGPPRRVRTVDPGEDAQPRELASADQGRTARVAARARCRDRRHRVAAVASAPARDRRAADAAAARSAGDHVGNDR